MLATSADAPATAVAVIALIADAAALDNEPDPGTEAGVEDVLITSARWFHVLRQVEVPDGEPVLVHVRLRRGHANPALVRRELASPVLHSALLTELTGRGEPRPPTGSSAGGPPATSAALPPPARPTPPLLAPPARGPRVPEPRSAPPRLPATPRHAAMPLGLPPRSTSGSAAAPLQAPPPPPPGAADGVRPRVAHLRTDTPPVATVAPGRPPSTNDPPGAQPDLPAGGLPKRVRGAELVGPSAAADKRPGEGAAGRGEATGVLRQGWLRDPATLRRLLSGLRRLA